MKETAREDTSDVDKLYDKGLHQWRRFYFDHVAPTITNDIIRRLNAEREDVPIDCSL